jgi:hypothetical protein
LLVTLETAPTAVWARPSSRPANGGLGKNETPTTAPSDRRLCDLKNGGAWGASAEAALGLYAYGLALLRATSRDRPGDRDDMGGRPLKLGLGSEGNGTDDDGEEEEEEEADAISLWPLLRDCDRLGRLCMLANGCMAKWDDCCCCCCCCLNADSGCSSELSGQCGEATPSSPTSESSESCGADAALSLRSECGVCALVWSVSVSASDSGFAGKCIGRATRPGVLEDDNADDADDEAAMEAAAPFVTMRSGRYPRRRWAC